ncbi:plasminogen-like [Mytilus trossulus]|uniref:plasminogen-like n=1 Tax=Mytilus trossulus TaxID=6551 RepID=UPI00300477FD
MIAFVSFKAIECIQNQLGIDYTGYVNTTDTGRTCQAWSDSYPHSHHLPEKLADDQNYCRNPDSQPYGPWCYTTDPNIRWEYCTVPFCDGFEISAKPDQDCRMDQQGKNYTGTISKTILGQKCQAWSSLVPNQHRYSIKMADQENYCRNPDNEEYGPWCYTTDPDTKWELCDIPYCRKDHWKHGWQKFEDSCYSIQYTETTWDEAKVFCQDNLNAYLAEITTAGENDFLMNLLPKTTVKGEDIEIWLGANNFKVEGRFIWNNSSAELDFTDWGPGEPNSNNERCLSTHLYGDGKLHWNSKPFYTWNFFVCEKSAGPLGCGE